MEFTDRDRVAAQIALLALAFAVVVRTAWISDDAQITLRCVMNFIHGYGPTFNIDERVQPYTHPLWFLLISAGTFISRNPFVVTFILSIAFSMLTLWLLVTGLATSFWSGILAGAALILSKAYIDFSTSGLENPLSHFLLALGFLLGFEALNGKPDERNILAPLTCLLVIYLSRPDLLLMVLPFCGLLLWRAARSIEKTALVVAIAAAPIILWTLFSVIYYGSPFPNTAYAKIGTGISRMETISQGLVYIENSISVDPITIAFTTLGVLLAMGGTLATRAIAAGIVAYLLYVVSIGGDFMSGRFLTAPMFAAAVILARTEFSAIGTVSLAVMFALLGAVSLPTTILSGRAYVNRDMPWSRITDERGYMYQGSGLAAASRDAFRTPRWVYERRRVRNGCGLLGGAGLNSGPNTHLIDTCGLADPLLARLPAKYDPNWRIGHFARQVPSGYTESFLRDENLIRDPATHRYWDLVRRVTRGPLFSFTRLKAILRLNLGLFEHPDQQKYRDGDVSPISVDLADVAGEVPRGSMWDSSPGRIFDSSIEIKLPSPIQISSFQVALAPDGKYLIEYEQPGGGYQQLANFGPSPTPFMTEYQLRLPAPTAMTERLRITAINGEGLYAVGNLVLKK